MKVSDLMEDLETGDRSAEHLKKWYSVSNDLSILQNYHEILKNSHQMQAQRSIGLGAYFGQQQSAQNMQFGQTIQWPNVKKLGGLL